MLQLLVGRRYLSTRILIRRMLIFMLGLLILTAILALDMVSNVKEMLTPAPVPVPVRVK